MTLDELLDHFDGARWNGTQWLARCPAHDDRSPSLAISEGDRGPIVHCHAGCLDTDVLKAVGLTWRDLRENDGTSFTKASAKERIVAEYDYRNADGELVYQVVRMEPKGFRQRRLAANYTGWEYNLQGVERVPYRLPELLAADIVWIAEGEKDVEALCAQMDRVMDPQDRHRLSATCNAGGAGKWNPDWGSLFARKHVVIVADKDEPGRAHARAVRASVEPHAASVRVVQAKVGKDAYDHLAAGLGSGDFEPVDLDAPTFHFEVLNLDERIPPAEWLLEGWIAKGDVVLLYGPPGAGKTFFAYGLEIALYRRLPFFIGAPVHADTGRSMHVDEEMPRDLVGSRLRALGLDEHWRQFIRYYWRQGIRLDESPELLLGDAKVWKPDLILLDSFTRFHGQDENAVEGIGRVLTDGILPLARETGAAVLLMHHSSRAGNPRGSSDIEAAVDAVIRITPDEEREGRFVITQGKTRRARGGKRLAVDIVDKSDGTVELVPDLLPQMRNAA